LEAKPATPEISDLPRSAAEIPQRLAISTAASEKIGKVSPQKNSA